MALAAAAVLVALELMGDLVRSDDGLARQEPLRRGRVLWWGASTVGLGVALSSWWLVPFVLNNDYSTQMGYLNVTTFRDLLFPHADLWAIWVGGAAVLVALATRSRFGILFSVLGGLSVLGLCLDPQGQIYNVRLLPLWFLCVYLMVGWLAAVVIAQLAAHVAQPARVAGLVRVTPGHPSLPVGAGGHRRADRGVDRRAGRRHPAVRAAGERAPGDPRRQPGERLGHLELHRL